MLATSAEVGRFQLSSHPAAIFPRKPTGRPSEKRSAAYLWPRELDVSGRSASSRILALAGDERHSKRWTPAASSICDEVVNNRESVFGKKEDECPQTLVLPPDNYADDC